MSQGDDIQIRALPRSNEKPNEKKKEGEKAPLPAAAPTSKSGAATPTRPPRWIIYVGTVSVLLLVSVFFLPGPKSNFHAPSQTGVKNGPPTMTAGPKATHGSGQRLDLASVVTPQDDAVGRHLQETLVKHEMLTQKRKLENLRLGNVRDSVDTSAGYVYDPDRSYGVQLDQEDASERLYEDLQTHDDSYSDATPDDRISNRLANRKWLNEYERAQRIQFVRSFLKNAYDRGYKIELDQNLVVVGVKRINRTEKLDINQVLDRLEGQGL
ncbi:MAG: hypothetical protein AB7G93_12185 [Bdellovibrionales bacterium]